jgi:hypothetical protein
MYKGYKLEFNGFKNQATANRYKQAGETALAKYKAEVIERLDTFLQPNGSFDGSSLIDNWFPSIDAQVFISHAHKDHEIALQLAGYLHEHFDLLPFIDSCVWNYANDLLKDIDKTLSCIKENSYSYELRNYTTGHVHMMLFTALNEMIYNTECFMFLKTNNSVPINMKQVVSRTESAWIYGEVKMSKMLTREKHHYRKEARRIAFSKGMVTESIDYELDDNHLSKLSWQDVLQMNKEYTQNQHPLDVLYKVSENNELLTD